MSLRQPLLVTLILTAVIGLDQLTKRIAEKMLSASSLHTWFYDSFRLQLVHNKGVLLGLGSNFSEDLRWWLFIFMPIVLLALALVVLLISKKLTSLQSICLAMIIGGGIGNLIDRIVHGSVTDFMNVGVASLRTGIFNVADMAILFGAIGLLLAEYGAPKKVDPIS